MSQLCNALLFCSLFLMVSCGGNASNTTETTEASKTVENNAAKPEPAPSQSNSKLKELLIGTWYDNHEPGVRDFNADGTYRIYVEAGMLDPDAPEEVYEKGNWTIKNDQLVMTKEGGEAQTIEVNMVDEKLAYLGNLENEIEEGMTAKEYVQEFGITKK